jgi:hypothetical protein
MKHRFQLAALQITFLCQMYTETDVRSSLKSLPKDLLNAYDEIYKRILDQEGSGRQLALNAFRWIKFSYEPLASETLLDAAVAEVTSESGEFFPGQVGASTILKCCQNLLILDKSLGVFRFAHLSVEEYLEGRPELTEVESQTYITGVCFSLLCHPRTWNKYDKTLKTREGDYKNRHLLLYSTVFWPWHFSRCEGADSGKLKVIWDKFTSEDNYPEWLNYQRSAVQSKPWSNDLVWQKLEAFKNQGSDHPLICARCLWSQSIICSHV